MGLIMYAKIACDCIIIKIDGWISITLKTCMYLAFGVMRSQIKGSYMYMRKSL